MKTFYFTHRRGNRQVHEVQAKNLKAAYKLMDENGCNRTDYILTNSHGDRIS